MGYSVISLADVDSGFWLWTRGDLCSIQCLFLMVTGNTTKHDTLMNLDLMLAAVDSSIATLLRLG